MIALENADEISSILDRFTKQKATEIPPELGKYINHVAKTGDTVYRWSAIQYLFREKIKTVIQEFQDTTTKVEGSPNKFIFSARSGNFFSRPFTPLQHFFCSLDIRVAFVCNGLHFVI